MCKINSKIIRLNLKKYHGCDVILSNVFVKFTLFDVDKKNIILISKDYITLPNYLYFNNDINLINKFILDEKNWQYCKNDTVFKAVGAPSVDQFLSPYKKIKKEPIGVESEKAVGFWTSTLLENSKSLIFVGNNGYMNAVNKVGSCVAFRPILILKDKAFLEEIEKGVYKSSI